MSVIESHINIDLLRLQERVAEFFHPRSMEASSVVLTPYGLAPWSASKLKTLMSCPLLFFIRYILKFKLEEDEDPDSTLRRNVGTTGHYIIEKMVDGYTSDEALLLAKDEYLKLVTPDRWHHVEALMPNIRAFNRRIFEFEERYSIVAADSEKMLAVDKDFRQVDFNSPDAFLRGIIDLAIRTEQNDSIQIDHKYGGTSAWGIDHHRLQLHICKVLEHFGSDSPIRGVQSGIHFMEAGQIRLDPYVSRQLVEVGMTKWVLDSIDKTVKSVLQDGKFGYKRSSKCIYCPMITMCKNGKRGTCGDLEFVVDASRRII